MNRAVTAASPLEPAQERQSPRRSRAELERLAAGFVGMDPPPAEPAAGPVEDRQGRRRSRQELEALAAQWVTSDVSSIVRKRRVKQRRFDVVGIAVAVVYISAVAWFVLPKDVREGTTRAGPVETAAGEAVLLQRKLEAERERRRHELESSRGFLEKMAAEEAATLRDLEQRARALEARAATPKAGPAPVPAQAATVEPVVPAATPTSAAPATEKPKTDVAAAKESCSIHVSELSASGTLTYADVARMRGARKDEQTGNVLTPPVKAAGGRLVSFEVLPTGCVRVVRTPGR